MCIVAVYMSALSMLRETKHCITKHQTHALPSRTRIRDLLLLQASVMAGKWRGDWGGGILKEKEVKGGKEVGSPLQLSSTKSKQRIYNISVPGTREAREKKML